LISGSRRSLDRVRLGWCVATDLLFCIVLTKLSIKITRGLFVRMCFDCMLHLSVCCFVNMDALVHIERRIAREMPKYNVCWIKLKVTNVLHKIIIICEI